MSDSDHYVRRILDSFACEPTQTVVWCAERAISAGELARSILVAAGAMAAHGVGLDCVVGTLTAANSVATLVLRYAGNLLGATVVYPAATNAVNPADSLTVDAQVDMLSDVGMMMLAVDKEHLARGRQLRDRVVGPMVLAGFEAIGADVVDLTLGEPVDARTAVNGSTAVVTYTSGSTGRPLGVAWSFDVKNRMLMRQSRAEQPQILLVTAPLTHSSGKMADTILVAGGGVVLHNGFDADRVLDAIASQGVTRVFLSAPQLYMLTDRAVASSADVSNLRTLMYTGCAPAPSRLAMAVETFGPRLFQLYGSSECGQISWLYPREHFRPMLRHTAGRPVPPVTVTIREPDGDHEIPSGELGEVCVRTPWGMSGYWRNPEATARVLRDGWIRTGDLGRVEEHGYLRLEGRLGEVIKANGIKVYPSRVEQVLLDHPDVARAAVFGVEDRDRIERVHAVVVPRAYADLSEADVRAHVIARLSVNHAPSAVQIRAEVPLSGLDKLDKSQLRAEALARLAEASPDYRSPRAM